jgi:hypothetical protein
VFDLLARRRPGSRLFGFVNGPRGITQGDAREITAAALVRKPQTEELPPKSCDHASVLAWKCCLGCQEGGQACRTHCCFHQAGTAG